jgi:allantoinase
MESLYDYGSRAGFWRLQRLFVRSEIPCTLFAVGMALERNPAVCDCLKQMMMGACAWEVASHGYRWIDYQNVDEATERDHIQRTVSIHERVLGCRPVGMYQGKVRERERERRCEGLV